MTQTRNGSEHVYTFRKTNQCVGCSHVSTLWANQIVSGVVSVVGMTATGDIVLSMKDASKPFFVLYLNIERSTLQRVTVLSVDHAEDLNFFNMETACDVMELLYPQRKLTRAGHPTSS